MKNWNICDDWNQRRLEQNVYEVPAPHATVAKRKRGAERLAMWKRASNKAVKKTKRMRTTPYTQKRVGLRRRPLLDHTPMG